VAFQKIAPTVVFVENYIIQTLKQLEIDLAVFPFLGKMAYLDTTRKPDLMKQYPELLLSSKKYCEHLGGMVGEELVDRVKRDRPEYLFMVNGQFVKHDHLREIRSLGTKIIVWFVDDPYEDEQSIQISQNVDFVFTVDSSMLSYYQAASAKNAYFLPLAAETSSYYYSSQIPEYELCLIGGLFLSRIKYFQALHATIQSHNYRYKFISPRTMTKGALKAMDNRVRQMVEFRSYEKLLFPSQVRQLYNSSKINLNIHRDSPRIIPLSPNERTFNIGACRAFQLIDDKRPDLARLYEIGKEIITFSDENELVDKIDFYLQHDHERETIAEKAYQRTLSEHTYQNRLKQLMALVQL
jgi:spore maturation protein CgeB